MRAFKSVAVTLFALAVAACAGVEVEPAAVDEFASKNYRYYTWRTKPLPAGRSRDPVYTLDPVLRREVDAILAQKGYVLDSARAEFSVDYVYAQGLRPGAAPEQSSNISPIPTATANRQIDQASVDNAIALGGLKETTNVLLQFNDVASKEEVWQAVMTKIVENANRVDEAALTDTLQGALSRAMRPLPPARAQ